MSRTPPNPWRFPDREGFAWEEGYAAGQEALIGDIAHARDEGRLDEFLHSRKAARPRYDRTAVDKQIDALTVAVKAGRCSSTFALARLADLFMVGALDAEDA